MSRTISVTLMRNMNNEELVQYTQSLFPLGDLEHELVRRLATLMNTLEEETTSESSGSTALLNNLQLQINALRERVDQLTPTNKT